MVHLGIATPYGGGGIALDVAPSPYFAIEGGIGTNAEGPELGLMPRLRLPIKGGGAFALGSGVSYVGKYTGHRHNGVAFIDNLGELMAEHTISYAIWQPAYFWNTELGIETIYRSLAMRAYVGYARALNHYTECTEGEEACSPSEASSLGYVGIAVGYAF